MRIQSKTKRNEKIRLQRLIAVHSNLGSTVMEDLARNLGRLDNVRSGFHDGHSRIVHILGFVDDDCRRFGCIAFLDTAGVFEYVRHIRGQEERGLS